MQTRNILVPILGIMVAVAAFSVTPLLVSAAYTSQASQGSYPIAFDLSFKINQANNYWYANVTNTGTQALGQFGIMIFNSSGYEITANSTSLIGLQLLKPGSTLRFATVCSDYYYSGAACHFARTGTYGISIVSWTGSCSCDHEITISGNVAPNKEYKVSTLPQIELVSNSGATRTRWSLALTNVGSATVAASAQILWGWNPCTKPDGCFSLRSLPSVRMAPSGIYRDNFQITKPHEPSQGSTAVITVTADYAHFAYSTWAAELSMSQSIVVK